MLIGAGYQGRKQWWIGQVGRLSQSMRLTQPMVTLLSAITALPATCAGWSRRVLSARPDRIDQENLATKLTQESFYRAVGAVRSLGLELEAHMELSS